MAQSGTPLWAQVETLRRIPEKMDPALYYKTFRPYIRFFESVVYEGVVATPLNFRGETGAQSSVIPTIVALLKVPHSPDADGPPCRHAEVHARRASRGDQAG